MEARLGGLAGAAQRVFHEDARDLLSRHEIFLRLVLCAETRALYPKDRSTYSVSPFYLAAQATYPVVMASKQSHHTSFCETDRPAATKDQITLSDNRSRSKKSNPDSPDLIAAPVVEAGCSGLTRARPFAAHESASRRS